MSGPAVQDLDRAITADAERVRTVYAARRGGHRYGWDQPGHLFIMQELERRLLRMFGRHGILPLGGRRVLEIGCGSGHFLRELVKWGADPARVVGIDLLEDRLAEARRMTPPPVRLEAANAAETGFADGSFDLVLQMTVFTSILSADVRQRVAAEMRRVLAPGGSVVWYDFRIKNPRNSDVRAVGRAEIRKLFPGATIDFEAATLAPPLARRLAPRAWWLCESLDLLPFLRTHYLALIRPPAGDHAVQEAVHG